MRQKRPTNTSIPSIAVVLVSRLTYVCMCMYVHVCVCVCVVSGRAEVRVCASVKRGLPYGKRDLLHAQKRPTDILAYLKYAQVSKETYYKAKETY